jgi:hypothetical protein
MADNQFDQLEDYTADFTDQVQLPKSGGNTPVIGPIPTSYYDQPSPFSQRGAGQPPAGPKPRSSHGMAMAQDNMPVPRNMEEFLMQNQAILRRDPLYGTGARTPNLYPEKLVSKYDDQKYGFIPGMDLDDFYGKQESWLATTVKGLTRLPVYTLTKAGQTFGYLGGLLSPWNYGTEEGIFAKAADNSLYSAMHKFEEYTKNEWMPTFQEAADRNKGFFHRMFTDGDFWAEDVTDGIGFMISSFVPGMAFARLGMGARMLRTLGGITRVGAKGAGAAVEGAESIANYFSNAQRAAKSIDAFAAWSMATAGESMFEATEVKNFIKENLRQDAYGNPVINPQTGQPYTESEINRIAGEKARDTFVMNAGLLGFTNVFQLRMLSKVMGFGEKALQKGLINTGATLATEATLKEGAGKLTKNLMRVAGGVGREGFIEENMQLAIQRLNQKYGVEGTVNNLLSMNTAKDLLATYAQQTGRALMGDDIEASTSIGLGAILGGGADVVFSSRNDKSEKLRADAAMKAFNLAQENWLKFGNIYKQQEVETKDAEGNVVKTSQLVLDEKGMPVIDEERLNAVVSGFKINAEMLDEADRTDNRYHREFLRNQAFANYVVAHINSGAEAALRHKLDGLSQAKPEDLAKLGFMMDETFPTQLQRHRDLAEKIIKQNEIINNSLLFDNSPEDQNRKATLTSLAASQVVAKEMVQEADRYFVEARNQLVTDDMTSLTDSLVEQLNELQYRIASQEMMVEAAKAEKNDTEAGIYQSVLDELKGALSTLKKNNPETLKKIEQSQDGSYLYEKPERNQAESMGRLAQLRARKSELLNTVRTTAETWKIYADNATGKAAFTADRTASAERLQKQFEEEKKKQKQQEEEKKKQQEDPDAVPAETPVADPPSDPLNPADPPAPETGNPPSTEGTQDVPTLEEFLQKKYESLQENPAFKVSYPLWVQSGAANSYIREYNKTYNKSEPLVKLPNLNDASELEQKLENLDLTKTTSKNVNAALGIVRRLYSEVKDNPVLLKKLTDKVQAVQDAFARDTLLKQLQPPSEKTASYIPLRDRGVNVSSGGIDFMGKLNMSAQEALTGFVVKGNEDILNHFSQSSGELNEKVRIEASRDYVAKSAAMLEKAAIDNRTMLTYENEQDIKRLKNGESIVTVAAKSSGFHVQIYSKDPQVTGNLYLQGIDSYAIVHPDNTTEPVTFSEEQRAFVKANMLVDGRSMSDEEYNRFQSTYKAMQTFNQEVEELLLDDPDASITPIFSKYFTLSQGKFVAQKGERFESLIQRYPERLFSVMVEDESGNVTEKQVPLVAARYGEGWQLDFVLGSHETLVEQDEEGNTFPVTDLPAFLKEKFELEPKFTNEYGGIIAWVANVPDDPKKYKPYTLSRDKGTGPVEYFKSFAQSFRELKMVIQQGASDNNFVFKGKKYSTINELLKQYNMNHYGFNRSGDWIVNLSYNPTSKKFAFELRPADREERNSLTALQKQALNLYFDDDMVVDTISNLSDDEVMSNYKKWINHLYRKLGDLGKRVQDHPDPAVKEMYPKLNSRAMFYYENTDSGKQWMLKLINKEQGLAPAPFLYYDGRDINGGNLQVALKDVPASTAPAAQRPAGIRRLGALGDDGFLQTPPPTPPPSSNPPSSTGRNIITRLDDEDPFQLKTEEQYEAYTAQSFNEEVQWLRTALGGTGIALRDLGTIIDKLSAGKQILGYYKDKALYVSEQLSAKGTIYHEAFHGLFRDLMTADQRSYYTQKALKKLGKISQQQIEQFRKDRRYTQKTDEQIRQLMAEEFLADGFKTYKLENKEPSENWFKQFVRLLERILNFLTRSRGGIDDLYQSFDRGDYASAQSTEPSSISKEGAFALAYGRPRLVEYTDPQGNTGFGIMGKVPMNLQLQNELVSKLTYRVSNMKEGSFKQKFDLALEQIKEDYNIDSLIVQNPSQEAAIRSRYEEYYNEARFVLGMSVPYVLDEQIKDDVDAQNQIVDAEEHLPSLEVIRQEVATKIKTLGLQGGLMGEQAALPEDDEDRAEKEKGGEFDKVHINPLNGLSKEFRSLFSVIHYTEKDPTLGIQRNRTADGNMLYNFMLKIAADKPLEHILPTLAKVVNTVQEDGDTKAAPIVAFANFIKDQFGIHDLSDPEARPSRNIFLYKQFIDTFFVTELPSQEILLTTTGQGSSAEIYDASIKGDADNKKEGIAYHYTKAFRRMRTDQERQQFNQNFEALKMHLQNNLDKILQSKVMNSRTALNKEVDKLKSLMDSINLVIPKGLIRQSLLAIYKYEMENEFSAKSTQNISDLEVDQRLMKEGAYLQKDFFLALSQIKEANYAQLMANTKDSNVVIVGGDKTKIDQLGGILKKATRYIVKYDMNAAIPMVQNAENEDIYRYTRYTPPGLLTQMMREKGVTALSDMYPILESYLSDNPIFDGSLQNQLFLKNLRLHSFGGFRQRFQDEEKSGVTFKSIDPKALMLSNIIHFMKREKVEARMKDSDGNFQDVSLVTFNRSYTQLEATTTNFLITGQYQRLSQGKQVSQKFVSQFIQGVRQEYNRIQREWARRDDDTVTRYNGYNNNLHPVTGEKLKADSYVVNGKSIKLRAYQFHNFKHFFEEQSTSASNRDERLRLMEDLLEKARKGISFEKASEADQEALQTQVTRYAEETFATYMDMLKTAEVIATKEGKNEGDPRVMYSMTIPNIIEEDYTKRSLEEYGYEGLEDLLLDQHLNIFINKMQVNQIFDGDLATGIKSAVEYYKRNKSGVISGNSMKNGHVRTSVLQNIQGYFSVDPFTGKEDLLKLISSEPGSDKKAVDIADGQSWHTINHRIRMVDAWGRLDSAVRKILNASKYRPLTKEEIETLEDKKVVLNSLKTATGGILEYYKLSEHLINRVDVSHLVVPNDMEVEDVHGILDRLYSQIETLEDKIVEDPTREDINELEGRIQELYSEVHQYWRPKRGREALHHLLNSMELDGIDQAFDTNASKKTTLVPTALNTSGKTNLLSSKSYTNGLFKFMQVETSGVKDKIVVPSQARQLLTTYIHKLDNDVSFGKKSIKDLAQEYSRTLGQITSGSMDMLDRIIRKDGELDISQLFETMYHGLKKQGADSNTLKYFEVRDGKPVHNPNLPVIKKTFTYYYFALFNDSVFRQRVAGRSDILVSSFGYEVLYDTQNGRIITQDEQAQDPQKYDSPRYKTRPLGVSVEEKDGRKIYSIEVIIPKPLAENEEELNLYLERMNRFFSTRIPTEDKRSMVVSKVVDYMDSAYLNSIVVPQVVHVLAGSDLDVDKLYSHTYDHYMDINGTPHIYGDYSNYRSKNIGRFVEYLHYMKEHPMLGRLVDEMEERMEEKPLFSKEFKNLQQELGIDLSTKTPEELKAEKAEIEEDIEAIKEAKEKLQREHDALFETYVEARQKDRKEKKSSRDKWAQKRAEYLVKKAELNALESELQEYRARYRQMRRTYRIAALVEVLKSQNLPVTSQQYVDYLKSNPTPVIPVLNNLSLEQKMDMLSHEKVFNEFYIQERSTVEPFREIAQSIGADVSDVIKRNSIYSIAGDVSANQLNASNKDGIGISASFNKFLAFAEKNDLSLVRNLVFVKDGSGSKKGIRKFDNSDGIRNIGQALGMFADAAKDPIPSVLNLNPDTAGVSNMLMAITGNLQMALLINKIPFIEKAVADSRNARSAAEDPNSFVRSISSLIAEHVSEIEDDLGGRLSELYEKDKKGKIDRNRVIPMYISTVQPEKKPGEETVESLGFQLEYENGLPVAADVAEAYLGKLYMNILKVNNDVRMLGKILNLIKNQNPDFGELSYVLSAVEYFKTGDSVFGESIAKVLENSEEYKPLIQAAEKMDAYSREILLDRSPLFASVHSILYNGFNNTFGNDDASEALSSQIVKFVVINKLKSQMRKELDSLKDKNDEKSVAKRQMLEESYEMFKADFWINQNTLTEDLDYLYDTHPSNPFVEFLKINERKGIAFLEASTRMKMDKDVTENIINGYEALQKSKDPRTLRLSRKMFYYLLIKDGLGYGSNTFIKYVNPDLPQFRELSASLDGFQKLLRQQDAFMESKKAEFQKLKKQATDDVKKQKALEQLSRQMYAHYNKLLDQYFENTSRPGQVDWINGMVNKIFSFAGNQKYIKEVKALRVENIEQSAKDALVKLVNKGVFEHIDPLKKAPAYFDLYEGAKDKMVFDYSAIQKDVKLIEALQGWFDVKYHGLITKEDGSLQYAYYPLLVRTKANRYFRLALVDDSPVSEKIALASLDAGSEIRSFSGMKAEYVEVKPEGMYTLLNFGFTPQDAQKIYEFTQPQSDEDLMLQNMGVDLPEGTRRRNSDNIGVNLDNLSGPINPGDAEIIGEDDLDMSQFTYRNNKNQNSSGSPAQGANDIGLGGFEKKKLASQLQPKQPSSQAKELAMEPENEASINAGTKTLTSRTYKLKDGLYTLPGGTTVQISYLGDAAVEYIGDDVIVATEDTGRAWSGDEFAKAEGYKSWADFAKNSKFSQKFVDAKANRYIYSVSPVSSTPQKSSALTQKLIRTMTAEKKKLAEQGDLASQREWIQEEISEFYDALRGKDTDEIAEETIGLFRTAQQFPKVKEELNAYLPDILKAFDSFDYNQQFSKWKAKKDAKGQAKDVTSQSLKTFIDSFGKQSSQGPSAQQGSLITYTPKGKQTQTYTVKGSKIFNKEGKEVFREDSVDRNKIFANLAVKQGRAVVVEHKSNSYVVNKDFQIISVKTGELMKWGPENGDRQSIVNLAKQKFNPEDQISVQDVEKIYKMKANPGVTFQDFLKEAESFINGMKNAGYSKSEILEQLKCL